MTAKRTNRNVRRDSRQHLTCSMPGCKRKLCAKGMCHNHWKTARYALLTPAERRAKDRKNNGLPEPTRPESAVCECCGRPPGKIAMNLDHCHTTGLFRGWLCNKCNTGLGSFGDSIAGLEMAINYLLLHSPSL